MSDDKLNIEIDGQPLEASKGAMIIEVADQAGIRIPRFCYHHKLSVAANCRMCLVEVERAPKPMPACATPVMDGMKVFTKSALALKAQKSVMEFLLINHPLDCPICDQGGECELQDIAMGYGRDVSRFTERKRVVADHDLGPLIATDMTRCIHCTRCVRFGEEIGGLPELGATGRGENMRIGTFIEQSVDSEMSGNVIDLCPVGALTSKPFRFKARAWEMQQFDSVAPHDGVGSNLHLHVRRNQVMRVVPRENEALNEVWLSDRDRFSYEGLYAEDRLLQPAIKRDGQWVDADWEEALSFLAQRLKAQSGPAADSIGFLSSASATTEELYLFQKLARGLGCPHVDHRLRENDFSDQDEAPAFPWLGQRLEELEQADAILFIGANPRKEHPIVNHRLRKAENAGARVMAINSVDYDFNYRLHAQLVISPAGIADALAHLNGDGKRSDDEDAILDVLGSAERPAILLGPSALFGPNASQVRAQTARLASSCGASLGQLPLGGNVAGAWLAGAVPHRGPGKKAATVVGMDAQEMLDVPRKSYVLMGFEPELDCANASAAAKAVQSAEFVAVLTAYRTEAMDDYADVLLPIAQFAETSGTYVNLEGGWQSFAGAVNPPGEARPAWKVLRVLGNVLELSGFDYMESHEVCAEVRAAAAHLRPEGGTWREATAATGAQSNGSGHLVRLGEVPLYAVDTLVRRAVALQKTRDARFPGLELNSSTADAIGLSHGGRATACQNGASITVDVVVNERVADGCVRLMSAVAITADLGPNFGAIEVAPASA